MTSPSTTIMVWLRNDLRIDDHPALSQAAAMQSAIVPVYCLDPRHWVSLDLGFPKTGSFRLRFILESLTNLRKNLQDLGADLWAVVGRPEDILPELAERVGASHLVFHREIADEERQVERAVEQRFSRLNIPTTGLWSGFLIDPDQLPFDTCPDVFTKFRKGVEKFTEVREPLPTITRLETINLKPPPLPTLADLDMNDPQEDPRAQIRFTGGEDAAQDRLRFYFWDQDLLRSYKFTRNGLLGDYASKLSPWLAHGCISPRRIHAEVKRYEETRHKNVSTYWLVFELLWRDFFRHQFHKHGNAFFLQGGLGGILVPEEPDHSKFEAWCQGRTGVPFIDANMEELNATGFMSNRGRQNVASFLIKDLRQPWRWGAAYFESQLVDYDVHSNWGNWAYVAGVGNDPRPDRYFNILRQADKYDRKGEFVRHWFEALADLPDNRVHQPCLQAESPLPEDSHFLKPLVDLESSADQFYTWARSKRKARRDSRRS